jgi:hypothetical protein
MTTSNPAALIPVVPMTRHAAPASWTASQRAELAERLAKVGTTITELSDARERLGFPRLSESSDWDREHAHENLESPEVQAVLVQIRLEHILLVQAIGARPQAAVRAARKLLGLRAGWNLRLGELEALLNQTRVVELVTETEHDAWAVVTRSVTRRRV